MKYVRVRKVREKVGGIAVNPWSIKIEFFRFHFSSLRTILTIRLRPFRINLLFLHVVRRPRGNILECHIKENDLRKNTPSRYYLNRYTNSRLTHVRTFSFILISLLHSHFCAIVADCLYLWCNLSFFLESRRN